MHITRKSNLPKPGSGKQVPDETLDRDTKIPLGDDGAAHKERQVETNTTPWNLLKREKRRE